MDIVILLLLILFKDIEFIVVKISFVLYSIKLVDVLKIMNDKLK